MEALARRQPDRGIEGGVAGSPDLAAVYREWSRPLYGTALRLLRRSADAEDAVQEAFVRFCSRSASVPEDAVGAWLHRVLINECIDRVRRARRWRWTEIRDSHSVVGGSGPGSGVDLDNAVRSLPERARLVFLLHDVEGFRHREIADLLKVSEGTSKSQLFRARELLRAGLEDGSRGTP